MTTEIESIVNCMAAFSLGDVQKEGLTASYAPLLVQRACAIVSQSIVAVYIGDRPVAADVTLKTWPRRNVEISNLTNHGHRCLECLRAQVTMRLPLYSSHTIKSVARSK
jgi:hypothetical protein